MYENKYRTKICDFTVSGYVTEPRSSFPGQRSKIWIAGIASSMRIGVCSFESKPHGRIWTYDGSGYISRKKKKSENQQMIFSSWEWFPGRTENDRLGCFFAVEAGASCDGVFRFLLWVPLLVMMRCLKIGLRTYKGQSDLLATMPRRVEGEWKCHHVLGWLSGPLCMRRIIICYVTQLESSEALRMDPADIGLATVAQELTIIMNAGRQTLSWGGGGGGAVEYTEVLFHFSQLDLEVNVENSTFKMRHNSPVGTACGALMPTAWWGNNDKCQHHPELEL